MRRRGLRVHRLCGRGVAPLSSAVFPLGLAKGSTRVHSICFKRPFESMAVSVISARALRAMARTVFLSVSVVEDLSGWVIVHDPLGST